MTGTELRVYCDDASHPTKRATVTLFVRLGPSEWDSSHRLGWQGAPGASAPRVSQHRVVLRDDEPASEQRLSVEDLPGSPDRIRHSLICPLCGLEVSVRLARLTPILDTLAEHGLASVSLGALAARVSSNSS